MPLDKTLIYQAIENPTLRKNIAVEELERIQAAYPYFATAQVLLAKLYQEQNDHRFADQLQQAAIYVGDRHVLYDYLQTREELEETKTEEVIEHRENAIPLAETEILENEVELSTPSVEEDENSAASTELEAMEQAPEVSTSIPVDIEDPLIEVEDLEEVELEEEVELAEEEVVPPSLESSVRRAVSAAFEEMKDFEEKIESVEEKSKETPRQIKSSELDALERNILVEAIHSTIEQEVDEIEEVEEDSTTEDRSSFQDIEEIAPDNQGEKSYAQLMMERARRMEGRSEETSSKKTPEISEEPVLSKIAKSSPKDHQKSLIDKFIREQPKITPGKASEYLNQQNLGKESLEEDFSVVTETMAKLFAAQGKFDKARKVYRQLIALHPEKSVYFAAQLKNLNQNKKI